MMNYDEVIAMQSPLIRELEEKIKAFVSSIPKEQLRAILLSGSVARGDYYPGELGGNVDLVVMKDDASSLSAADLFGENVDPGIPYHCIREDDVGYQILFCEFITVERFKRLGEPRKYALLESRALWQKDGCYTEESRAIGGYANSEIAGCLDSSREYISYLLSEYKTDRWRRRQAYPQLHANLNVALQRFVDCLYYRNGKYAPAEERRLYYSYTLPQTPDGYSELINRAFEQNMLSYDDYLRRERLFKQELLSFIALT